MEIGCGDSRSGETGSDGVSAAKSPVSGLANVPAETDSKGCEDKSPGSGLANGKAGKSGRNGGGKIGHSLLNSVNKSASQIRKPPHRRSVSPVNWFPRKKTDSFLKRKIKLLQETEGMNSSLVETLGNANPHYTRIAREKIAAREAAKKAMEARKAAMIEASWCRILHAARIHSKEAEEKLEKAEKHVAEAFVAAAAMGVMMYDRPDCPRRSCEIETSSVTGGTSTHKVTASFQTAFEVDKEVAAAVKKAFMRLAKCSLSSNEEEFRDLLRKISQNPDVAEMDQGLTDVGSEMEPELPTVDFNSNDATNKCEKGMKQININGSLALDSDRSFQSSQDLVDMMFDRLKCLPEDEVASLAVIVATCGLNAALLEMEKRKVNNLITDGVSCPAVTLPTSTKSSTVFAARRLSTVSSFIHGHIRRKEPVSELPSLDKFLVKHVTRLEKEVQEAKNLKKICEVEESVKEECEKQISENGCDYSDNSSRLPDSIPDLGSILVKHVSRLVAKNPKKNNAFVENGESTGSSNAQFSENERLSYLSKVTKEVNMEKQSEQKSMQQRHLQCGSARDSEKISAELDETDLVSFSDRKDDDKENMELNKLPSMAGGKASERNAAEFQKVKTQPAQTKCSSHATVKHHITRSEQAKLEILKAFSTQDQQGESETQELISLEKILIKPVHRLQREKMKALERADHVMHRSQKCNGTNIMAAESLDKVLVKHVSRLEREKMAALTKEGIPMTTRRMNRQVDTCVEGLDRILVKHQSKLEKAKLAAAQDQFLWVKGKKVQEFERCTEGLDQVLVKHQSELEKAKLEVAQDQILPVTIKKTDQKLDTCIESLDQILVKHQSKLEKAKLEAVQDQNLRVMLKGKKDLQFEMCTEGLDKILVKHQSKLEKAKLEAVQDPILPVTMKEKKGQPSETCAESLDQVLVKHQSTLEKDKFASAWEPADRIKSANTWREARERELREAWGGLSLGNTVKPHLSRLEREKAAWKRAEEEELRRVR